MRLTLEEIAKGVDKTIYVRRQVRCDACEGSGAKGGREAMERCRACGGSGERRSVRNTMLGQIVSVQPCRDCQGEGQTAKEPCKECWGEGRVEAKKSVKVNVPAGVSEGQYLTMRGEGDAGKRGGPPGDLQIEFKELDHELFQRRGTDLYRDLYVSFADAVLGAKVEVSTLDGTRKLTIKPGTQSGHKFRLPGKGLPEVNNSWRKGDMHVIMRVWTPKALTRKDKKIVENLRNTKSFDPPANGGTGSASS